MLCRPVHADELFIRHVLHFVWLVLAIDKQNRFPVGYFRKRSRYDKKGELSISQFAQQHEAPPILLLLLLHRRGIRDCLTLPQRSQDPLRLTAK